MAGLPGQARDGPHERAATAASSGAAYHKEMTIERYERAAADGTGAGGPAALRLPPGALLVVAGVPGAGKTTLLGHVDAGEALVLDPEPIRDAYQRWLGRLPYRLWRPLVHAEFYARVLLALPAPAGLIVHETGTRGWVRRLLVTAAARCGRSPHLLLLDVPAAAALAGQRQRRRVHPPAAFQRHWDRWQALRARAGDGGQDTAGLEAEGWASVRLIDRPTADRLVRIDIPLRLARPGPVTPAQPPSPPDRLPGAG